MSEQKDERSGGNVAIVVGSVLMTLLVYSIPLLAVGLNAAAVVVVLTPNTLPMWAAVPVGILCGILALAFVVCINKSPMSQSYDLMDVAISCFVSIFLGAILLSASIKGRENRLQREKIHQMQVQEEGE